MKDPELYEELRADGASKEKAARISNAAANTSRSAVGRKGGRSGDYDDLDQGRPDETGPRDRCAGPLVDEQVAADPRTARPLKVRTAEKAFEKRPEFAPPPAPETSAGLVVPVEPRGR